ncbi:MAG TPA: hypothetical protein DD390_15405, partial [Rhodospirillaceae bacterium]|nr:hypothetical protein [Rhodospirillaceae bacterium]
TDKGTIDATMKAKARITLRPSFTYAPLSHLVSAYHCYDVLSSLLALLVFSAGALVFGVDLDAAPFAVVSGLLAGVSLAF